MSTVIIGAIAAAIGLVLGYVIRQSLAAKQASSLEEKSKKVILEAQKKADLLVEEAKKDEKERKSRMDTLEERLMKKDESLEQRSRELSKTETSLKQELSGVERAKQEAEEMQ